MLIVAALLAVGCAGGGRLELSRGDPARSNLGARVDSEPARRVLVDILAHRSLDRRTVGLVSTTDTHLNGLPDRAQLHRLARGVSVDFAAPIFARALASDERSRAVQAAFDAARRDGVTRSERLLQRPGGFPYTVLLAPAWLYRSHPEVGADFARQRRLVGRLSIAHQLIPTPESASVEDNASVIAAAVRDAGRDGRALIVVSTSKSGAEAALAQTDAHGLALLRALSTAVRLPEAHPGNRRSETRCRGTRPAASRDGHATRGGCSGSSGRSWSGRTAS